MFKVAGPVIVFGTFSAFAVAVVKMLINYLGGYKWLKAVKALFDSQPVIIASATVGGPLEAEGPLSEDIDILHDDPYMGQDSFEKAEKLMIEEAAMKALEKAGVDKDEVGVFISGDLINQIIASSFAARTLGIPYLGIYGACSSSMEGLAIAASLVDGQKVKYVLTGASSHNNSAEKQYRYPNEYGAQKPPTSQWTVKEQEYAF